MRRVSIQRPSSGGPQAEINITPLVDVVLVLLIIFMVVTPLEERWLEVQVPQPGTEGQAELAPPVVSLEPTRVLVDGVPSLPGQLGALLGERLSRSHAGKTVLFQASGAVPYGQLVAAMDEAKRAGADALGWIPRPDGAAAR